MCPSSPDPAGWEVCCSAQPLREFSSFKVDGERMRELRGLQRFREVAQTRVIDDGVDEFGYTPPSIAIVLFGWVQKGRRASVNINWRLPRRLTCLWLFNIIMSRRELARNLSRSIEITEAAVAATVLKVVRLFRAPRARLRKASGNRIHRVFGNLNWLVYRGFWTGNTFDIDIQKKREMWDVVLGLSKVSSLNFSIS